MSNATNADINAEILLAEKGGRRTVWLPAMAAPLQIRRGPRSIFGARAEEIWEWAEAPRHILDRASAIAARHGASIDEANTLVAYDCPSVLLVTTPEMVRRIRELLPAARKLHEEAIARAAAEERERAEALERARAEAIAACPADCEPCTTGRWFDGLIECIAADGTRVDQWDDIDRHGGGIVYVRRDVLDKQRAHDASERAEAERRAAEKAAEAARQAAAEKAAFEKARATGERQLIRTYATSHCMNGNDDECSLDNAYVYAMPDGTTKTIYICTF